jgi:hypothetical protein
MERHVCIVIDNVDLFLEITFGCRVDVISVDNKV